MRIGIVTPAFNIAPYIGTAIRSVQAQTHRDWTMTIVDDGSTDRTAEAVAGFADPRIRLIRQENMGVSAARNRGLGATDAGAILFLDGDDWLSPEALTALEAPLRSNLNAVAAVGAYVMAAGPVGLKPGSGPGLERVRRPAAGDLLKTLLVRNVFANGGHVLIHRAAVTAAGRFLTTLRYGEDWEYWTRLARLGAFAPARSDGPLLFVRERLNSAYRGMAGDLASFGPCMDAIYQAPGLRTRFSAAELARSRRRAEAENDWIVGRELIRHGKHADGMGFLRRSVRAAPGFRRLALLAAGTMHLTQVGPFRPYSASGTA